jgi:hypothetical protein
MLVGICSLVVTRFRQLGHHFLKMGDFANISFSRMLHFVQSAGLLIEWAVRLHKGSETFETQRSLWCCLKVNVLRLRMFQFASGAPNAGATDLLCVARVDVGTPGLFNDVSSLHCVPSKHKNY